MKNKLLSILALATLGAANLRAQTLTYSVINQPCNNDGHIIVSTTGLTPPINFTYYLYNSSLPMVQHTGVNSTTDHLTNIPAIMNSSSGFMAFFIQATDALNQTAMYTGSLNLPFTYSTSSSPAICPSPGSLQVNNIVGGTAPFSYLFKNNITLQSYATNPITAPTGNYAVTVTDAAGCKVLLDSAYIAYQSPVNVQIASTPANCTNGTAMANTSGGTLPYTYLWSNGALSQGISNLLQGAITCTVTDAQGCIGSGYGYVQQNPTLTFNTSVTNANCLQNNGSIIGFPGGGAAPYTYLWNNGATTPSISGLSGNQYYNVQFTDANGCKGSGGSYISSTTPINVTYAASPSSCTSATGSATVIPTGGTAPYTIVWNTYPATVTGASLSNVTSGTYAFTVTDAAGCVRTGTAFIPPVSTINAYVNSSSIPCPSTNGSISVTASGTNSPFTYLWNTGATTLQLTNVPYGSYNCTIKDALGCSVTKSGWISQYSPITVGFASTPASCIFTADGALHANATGGTAPYTYTWSNTQTGANINGLAGGNYYVTVTDANGCHNNYNNSQAYVNVNTANTSCYCTITGTVYADANNNCTRDGGENGIPNVQIHASGLGYTYTDANGVYSFMAPSGTYTVSESIQQIYPLASCQSNHTVVSVTAGTGCSTSVNFANTILPIHDLHIITTSINLAIPGSNYQQKVIVQNEGTVTESNIQLGYTHDGQLAYSNCTPWVLSQQNAGTYPNWYSISTGFPTLNAGAASTSLIDYNVPTNIPINTVVNFHDSVAHAAPLSTTWLTDNTPWNNVDHHEAIIVGSFDPNFKEVSPKGTGPQGYIQATDSILTYVIHFQNEGTYFTKDIVVVDTLDAHLNISSIRPGYSDYHYTTEVSDNGVIRFKFNNINLPWKSAYGDVMSSGMFTYSVKLKKNLSPGTPIKNTAAIYFDYNTPVITNTTLNTISGPVSVKELSDITANDVTLYPNPTHADFFVRINSTVQTESEVSISDINGRIVSQHLITLQAGENTLQENTQHLQSGVYFFQLKNRDTLITKKLVVVK